MPAVIADGMKNWIHYCNTHSQQGSSTLILKQCVEPEGKNDAFTFAITHVAQLRHFQVMDMHMFALQSRIASQHVACTVTALLVSSVNGIR